MAEPVNSDDHWHSLAPIHTSPSSRKHVANFNLQVNDLYFESINSLVNYDKLDHHNIHSFQISPPSSGSSTSSTLTHVSFLHTLTSTSSKGQLFTKCNNNSPVYTTTSLEHHHHNTMAVRRLHGVGLFQSFLGVSRVVVTPRSHRGGMGAPALPLTPNSFTMMPANVVGKKKPPGYVSDEPTSPEVTCMGRVRRNKHCKAWDALLLDTEMTNKLNNIGTTYNNTIIGNGTKLRSRSRGSTPRSSIPMSGTNVLVPRPLAQPAMYNRWKNFWANMAKDIKIHMPNLTKRLRKLHKDSGAKAVEEFMLADILRRRALSSSTGKGGNRVRCSREVMENMLCEVGTDVRVDPAKGVKEEGEGEEKDSQVKVDKLASISDTDHMGDGREGYSSESESESRGHEDSCSCPSYTEEPPLSAPVLHSLPLTPSLPSCLLLGRNSSRRKVFHSNDDDGDHDHHGHGYGHCRDFGAGTASKCEHLQPNHDVDQCHVRHYNSDDEHYDDGHGHGHGHEAHYHKNPSILVQSLQTNVLCTPTNIKRSSSKGIKHLFRKKAQS